MDSVLSKIPLSARRAIEAEIITKIMVSAEKRVGAQQARAILDDAIATAAFSAGQAFAAKAPGGAPSLEHFAKVLDIWQMGGALDIADIRQDETSLSFSVIRCGYVNIYRDLGIPAGLHAALSCSRDAAFAAGYSSRLSLERPETIAQGALRCAFLFRWT